MQEQRNAMSLDTTEEIGMCITGCIEATTSQNLPTDCSSNQDRNELGLNERVGSKSVNTNKKEDKRSLPNIRRQTRTSRNLQTFPSTRPSC
jgi:hypothetical protein